MNQMAQDVEHSLYYDTINVAEITGFRVGAWMADRLCTVKGLKDWVWPAKDFLALLETLPVAGASDESVSDTEGPLPANVVDLAVYRKR